MSNSIQFHKVIDIEYVDSWGSILWDGLHAILSGYPREPTEEHKKNYRNYIESLGSVLPCEECQEHWQEVLEEKPLMDGDMINRETINRWSMDIHNVVNRKLGKNVKYNWRQYCEKFPSIKGTRYTEDNEDPEDNEDDEITEEIIQVKAEKIKPQKVRVKKVIPNPDKILRDPSLGKIHSNVPMQWRNSVLSQPKYIQIRQSKVVKVKVEPKGKPRRKKCGCANKK